MTRRRKLSKIRATLGIVLLITLVTQPALAVTFTEYAKPTPGSPIGITAGPDGNLWFTEPFRNKIGKVTTTGSFTEYAVPTPSSTLEANSFPVGITAGPDGNLWFTEAFGDKIGKVTTTGSFTEYALPTPNSFPVGITVGPDGNLWFSEEAGNKIGVVVLQPTTLKVSKFFTDSSLNPLPLDSKGNPKVDVVLAGGVVKSTNPGQVLAWVNVTNTARAPLQSLKLNETLPVDWVIAPPWMPAKGAIHVFYANTTSLATNPEITQPSTITVSPGLSEIVHLGIPSFNATAIGHPLLKNQSILLSVKLDYGLDGTQRARNYPLNYTDTAKAKAWTMPSYTGIAASPSTGKGFFTAYAKVVGDVDGDGSVDITDLVLVWQRQFTNDPRYDVNGDGAVDINDLVITWQYQFT